MNALRAPLTAFPEPNGEVWAYCWLDKADDFIDGQQWTLQLQARPSELLTFEATSTFIFITAR